MLALKLIDAGNCELAEVAPVAVGSNDVRVKMSHVGLCGSDLNSFRGLNPLVEFPRIPGHEASGIVVEVGNAKSSTVKVGQRVIIWPYSACGRCNSCVLGRTNACQHNQTLGVQRDGILREEAVLPQSALIPIDNLPLDHMALVEPLSVGFHAARRASINNTDTIVVLGCGVIGLGAIMSAAQSGACVIAIDLLSNKEAIARQVGAQHFVALQGDELAAEIERLTEGRGANVVIEAVGAPQTFVAAVELTAFCGRVVYVGYSKAPVTYDTKLFNLKELDIFGSRNAERSDFDDVIGALATIGESANSLISHQFFMKDAANALPFWNDNPQDCIKIMVTL